MSQSLHSTSVELRSDTKTKPCAQMRAAIAAAEVGDSQLDEDPTCEDLCERVATLLGKEKAIFMPSGTMCNQIAMRIHCGPGDEIICHETAHVLSSEAGGMATLSGASVRPLSTYGGYFGGDEVANALRIPQSQYWPQSRLLVIEQTANFPGGTVWPLTSIEHAAQTAHAAGMAVHMDGARLLNAVVATGVSAATYAASCDSVWIDFTKGLGAPIGAVLAGSSDFIFQAKRFRQMFGGALRQAGIAAAGCIFALEHNIERLRFDHDNATELGRYITEANGIELVEQNIETNIVLFQSNQPHISNAEIVTALANHNVLVSIVRETGDIRAVTHLDVSADNIARAGETLASIASAI